MDLLGVLDVLLAVETLTGSRLIGIPFSELGFGPDEFNLALRMELVGSCGIEALDGACDAGATR